MTHKLKDRKPRGIMDPRVRLAVAIIVLTIAGVFFYLLYVPGSQSSGALAIDWRVKLHIYNTRYQSNSTPPAGIGAPGGIWYNHTYDMLNGVWVGPPGYAPLNTRDDYSGTIYVQSTACCPAYIFTLGYFFSEWGKLLTESCVIDYCTSPGETIVYHNDSSSTNTYAARDTVIYTAGSSLPPLGTVLSSDPDLRFVDSNSKGFWIPGEAVVYDSDHNGKYDVGDVVVQAGGSSVLLGYTLSSDPKIKYVESDHNPGYDPRHPPPVMSDGRNPERCVSPQIGLSNNYDWVIITWSTLSQTVPGNCVPR